MSAWQVWWEGDLVLSGHDGPGPLTSTARRAPGAAPPTHPFVTAAAHDADHEDRLRTLLEEATDAEDFRRRLVAAGYRVDLTPNGG